MQTSATTNAARFFHGRRPRSAARLFARRGIERAIFKTNFRVAGLRIGYGALVAAMRRMLGDFSAADRERFVWRNAKAPSLVGRSRITRRGSPRRVVARN